MIVWSKLNFIEYLYMQRKCGFLSFPVSDAAVPCREVQVKEESCV